MTVEFPAVESRQDRLSSGWLEEFRWLIHVPDLEGELRTLQRLMTIAIEYAAQDDEIADALAPICRRIARRHEHVLDELKPELQASQSDIFLG